MGEVHIQKKSLAILKLLHMVKNLYVKNNVLSQKGNLHLQFRVWLLICCKTKLIFFCWKNICFLQNIRYLQKKCFYEEKKNFYREKYKWKCKKKYISFQKYIFTQKMFVLQTKCHSFLNIYWFCKRKIFWS